MERKSDKIALQCLVQFIHKLKMIGRPITRQDLEGMADIIAEQIEQGYSMHVKLYADGKLAITPSTELESFALSQWESLRKRGKAELIINEYTADESESAIADTKPNETE